MQTLDGTSTQPTPDVEIVAVAPLTHEIPAAQPAAVAFPASGLYQSAPGLTGEELRLDVDGRYPQMVGSGTIRSSLTARVHWVANLTVNGPNSWKGPIWYKNGATSTFPYTSVKIDLSPGAVPSQQRATATFSAGGFANRVRTFQYQSPYFRTVEFEFDTVQGTAAVLDIETGAHSNRPPTLPIETLSIQAVYQRAGFDTRISPGSGGVPLAGAGANARWSDMEMHDAMRTYWSRFANRAQWAAWVLFAARHESGPNLGGIMFDQIGPNHRQGTAMFNDSFIAQPPPGDAQGAAWVRRMRFWTACHEIGHAFNLAHSWDKAAGGSWIPLANEPTVRSFMNYPFKVAGGQTAFFADFEYRFSESELLFMRHAPERFVQMGAADWFDHHAFEQAAVSPEPALRLELRVNRPKPQFEFLEPVVLELKLTNVSTEPRLVEENLLASLDRMTVILKKQGQPARRFIPYAQYCWQPRNRVLQPGESTYESLFVSAGLNGWDLAEPGCYTVQVALRLEDEDAVSNPLSLRVLPPYVRDEEVLAQDFFSDDVGRILTFDGSRTMLGGNDTLQTVADRFSAQPVARHARVALANAQAVDYKELVVPPGSLEVTYAAGAGGAIQTVPADLEGARSGFAAALTDDMNAAAETLGHIDYKYYVDRYTDWLAARGDPKAAAQIQDGLYKTMQARGVLARVLQEITARRDSYKRLPRP